MYVRRNGRFFMKYREKNRPLCYCEWAWHTQPTVSARNARMKRSITKGQIIFNTNPVVYCLRMFRRRHMCMEQNGRNGKEWAKVQVFAKDIKENKIQKQKETDQLFCEEYQNHNQEGREGRRMGRPRNEDEGE